MLEIGIGTPVEGWHSGTFTHDAMEIVFKVVEGFEIFIEDFGHSGPINANATSVHFQNRPLEGFGEFIRRPFFGIGVGTGVEFDFVENLTRDATIETVVDLVVLELGEGFGIGLGGVDYTPIIPLA